MRVMLEARINLGNLLQLLISDLYHAIFEQESDLFVNPIQQQH